MDKAHTLKRSEIIRGYNRFNFILENGKKILTNNISAFCMNEESFSDPAVEVGFLISKKKLKNLTREII